MLAVCALAASHAAWSADDVVLNFVNADIESVVRAVSEITGRNFVVDPKVKGVVNIISSRPVPRSLVYPTLLSALRLQGYTAVESDGITKIVVEAEAKQHASTVAVGGPLPAGDRLVTQVYPLRHESATQMVAVLRPLITPNNTIAAFPSGNALLITDYAENLRRIDRIVASLDQPPQAEPVIVPLRHASAIDVAQTVGRMMLDTPAAPAAANEPQQRNAVVAEPRSNSIIVRADSPARLARVRAFIEQLDTPARAGSNIRIVYLRNAEAARVAQTLRALLGGGDSSQFGAGAPLASPGGPGIAGTFTTVSAPGQPGMATAVQAAQAAPLSQAAYPAAATGAFTAGGATIQADPTNNALVILAPEPVYNNLREVIEKLDVRRAQVYVEALVAELTAERAAEFGVQWQYIDPVSLSPDYSGSGRGAGGTNFGLRGTGVNILDGNLGLLERGLNVGILRGQITIPGTNISIANIGVLVHALAADANANILSMPNLLTLDNEPAQVVIGQNIPIVTGSYTTNVTSTSGQPNPFQTFERRDVGLVLRIKPQITEGGAVKMQIYQEVSSVADQRTFLTQGGVVTNKRALESTVLVDDGQIIVLGGLMQDSLSNGADKVPVLGDLPYVGQLFRYDSRKRAKTNLMVFLRPKVIRTPAASQSVTADRYDFILGEQQRSAPDQRWFWVDPTAPALPQTGQVLPAESRLPAGNEPLLPGGIAPPVPAMPLDSPGSAPPTPAVPPDSPRSAPPTPAAPLDSPGSAPPPAPR